MATNRQNIPPPGRSGRRFFPWLIMAMLSLATAGCVGQGLLYTRVVKPYSRNFHDTPTGSKTCRVNEHIFREPVSGADVSVLFTSRVVEEAARTAGLTKLYYADLETLRVLKGVYEKRTLILCGD